MREFRKTLSGILAVAMILTSMNTQVYADEILSMADNEIGVESEVDNPQQIMLEDNAEEDLLNEDESSNDVFGNSEEDRELILKDQEELMEWLYEDEDDFDDEDEIIPIEDSQELEAQGSGTEEVTIQFNQDVLNVGTVLDYTITSENSLTDSCVKWYIDGDYMSQIEEAYTLTEADYYKVIKVELYEREEKLAEDSIIFTDLPLVEIKTNYTAITGDKSAYQDGSMKIYGNYEYDLQYDGDITIKGRGSSTWECIKKPFKLKLNKKKNLFDMGKNKHWVLLANDYDDTLIRNTVGTKLSGKLGLEYMDSVPVDVAIYNTADGTYQYYGNYILCEHIRIGSSRINITDWEDIGSSIAENICSVSINELNTEDKAALDDLMETDLSWMTTGEITYKGQTYKINEYLGGNDLPNTVDIPRTEEGAINTSGGFLFEFDQRGAPGYSGEPELTHFLTDATGTNVNIKKPEYLSTNAVVMDYIKKYINGFEESIMNYESYSGKIDTWEDDYKYWANRNKSYVEYADIDSMAALFLVNEIMWNYDAKSYSRYAYMDVDGKLIFGPAWDFDLSMSERLMEGDAHVNLSEWCLKHGNAPNFFKEWIDDPYFQVKLAEKYYQIRPYLTELVRNGGLMDSYIQKIGKSAAANNEKYAKEFNYDEQCAFFKNNMATRIEWLDKQFASLDTLNASLCWNGISGCAYEKSAHLRIDVEGANEGKNSILSADWVVSDNSDVTIKIIKTVAYKDDYRVGDIGSYNIYVNGIYVDTAKANAKNIMEPVYFTIEKKYFTEPKGKNNVINVYGNYVNHDFDKLGKTFITVAQGEEFNYTKKVHFDPNGGTINGQVSYNTTVPYGGTISSPGDAVREHYIFKGWYLGDKKYKFTSSVYEDITLVAHWEPAKYTVSFNGNGGKVKDVTNYEASVSYNECVENPGEAVREGYTFDGWYLGDEEYDFATPVTQGIVLTAHWKINEYTVSFNGNGGTISGNYVYKITVSYNTIIASVNAVREEYIFAGWYDEDNKEYDFSKPVTRNITLTARWINNNLVTVSFNGNGGTINGKAMYEMVIPFNSPVDNPGIPQRLGYRFRGWYLNNTTYDFAEPVMDNITLTARWEYAGDVLEEDWPEGDIPDGLWVAGTKDLYYTGKSVKQTDLRIYYDYTLLKEGKDYKLSYKNNVKAAQKISNYAPTVIVTAKGNYSGVHKEYFNILRRDISSDDFASYDMNVTFSKKTVKPVPKIKWNKVNLKAKKDYSVIFYKASDVDKVIPLYSISEVGDYTAVLEGIGNFCGKREIHLYVDKKDRLISKATVKLDKNQAYTGNPICPKPQVYDKTTLLTENIDYVLDYSNNVENGTGTVLILGIGSYTGFKKVNFTINSIKLKASMITGVTSTVYTGLPIEHKLIIDDGLGHTLEEDVDYIVTYKNNTKVGTATVTVKGIGAYTGSITKKYKITPYDILTNENLRVKYECPKTVIYKKGGAIPSVTVTYEYEDYEYTLVNGRDYTISAVDSSEISGNKVPTVIIKGKGNYKGKKCISYKVTKADISDLAIAVKDVTFKEKKNNYKTSLTVTDVNGKKLQAGTDYDKNYSITYKEDTNITNSGCIELRKAGEAVRNNDVVPADTVMVVELKGVKKYYGSIIGEYRITKASVSKAKYSVCSKKYTREPITLSKEDLVIKVGKTVLTPEDYEIMEDTYKNNINKGTATVKIRGVGNYGGTFTIKFKIKEKPFPF